MNGQTEIQYWRDNLCPHTWFCVCYSHSFLSVAGHLKIEIFYIKEFKSKSTLRNNVLHDSSSMQYSDLPVILGNCFVHFLLKGQKD